MAAAAIAAADEEAKRWRAAAARSCGGGQSHTEGEWEGDEGSLPAGSCNLYTYPLVASAEFPKGERPSASGLRLLRQIVFQLIHQTSACDRPDEVGAFAIHALVVCNNPDSLALAMDLYRAAPRKLLPLVHVPHRNGTPIFVGESSLHILAVNRHEDEARPLPGANCEPNRERSPNGHPAPRGKLRAKPRALAQRAPHADAPKPLSACMPMMHTMSAALMLTSYGLSRFASCPPSPLPSVLPSALLCPVVVERLGPGPSALTHTAHRSDRSHPADAAGRRGAPAPALPCQRHLLSRRPDAQLRRICAQLCRGLRDARRREGAARDGSSLLE